MLIPHDPTGNLHRSSPRKPVDTSDVHIIVVPYVAVEETDKPAGQAVVSGRTAAMNPRR